MKAAANRPGRPNPKRPATLTVPEHTSEPAKPQPRPPKESIQDEAIRKMLEAAYT